MGHLFIPDLHRTAQALKADLGHLDRPAALLALLDPAATPPHERLIRRLAAARGEWSPEATASAVSAVLDSCAGSDAGISLALVVGQRAFAGAAPGSASSRARCWRVTESGAQATKEVLSHDFAESGPAHLVLAIGELGDLEAPGLGEPVRFFGQFGLEPGDIGL
ncbi:unnamed protein product [Effrenium voratum]|nr:unnamed protein product [Effrenium voratum]